MPSDREKAEAELRDRIYTALIQMTFAAEAEKRVIAERLKHASGQLYDLVVNNSLPELPD